MSSDISQVILKLEGIRIRISSTVFMPGVLASSVIVIVEIAVESPSTLNSWLAALDMLGVILAELTTILLLVPLAAPVVAVTVIVSLS